MNEQIPQIARRVKELREILGFNEEETAQKINVDLNTYLSYESGKADMPVSVLYSLSKVLQVDPTVILTGEEARMSKYTVVRGGKGIKIERYKGYSFTSLAFNYNYRDMEPMIVELQKNKVPANLVSHPGQEFNYVLEGTVRVVVAENKFVLNVGDTIYFDATLSHGQFAETDKAKFLTVINEYSINHK